MSRVSMTHPDLPGQPIDVDEASVPGHRAAGWQVAEDLQKPKAVVKRRRPTPKGDES